MPVDIQLPLSTAEVPHCTAAAFSGRCMLRFLQTRGSTYKRFGDYWIRVVVVI